MNNSLVMISFLYVTLSLFVASEVKGKSLINFQIDRAYPAINATPAERPQKTFSGRVNPRNCPFDFNEYFLGRVQDGNISGMAGEGVNYDWPIHTNGTFGGKLPLKKHQNGKFIFQLITGRVDGDNLLMDIKYILPNNTQTLCKQNGIKFFLGG